MIPVYVKSWRQLIRFGVVLLTRSFATLHETVRTYPLGEAVSPSVNTDRIVAAFEATCVWYPTHVRCLQRSAALTCLLRSYGVAAHMVIGSQRLPFKAHAWVEVNGKVLNDKEYTPEMYAVLDRC
jgi:hypothetical protein